MSGVRVGALTVLLWIGLAVVTALLHLLGAGFLVPPPLLHPDRLLAWWQGRGALLATFGAARQFLCGVGAYLWALWTVVGLASFTSSARLQNALWRCRLPGARVGVSTVLGVSALGAALVAGATPTLAAGGTDSPRTVSTAAAGQTAAPVLRYVGPAGAPVRPDTGPPRPQPETLPMDPGHPVPSPPGRRRLAPISPPPAVARDPAQVVRPSTAPAARSGPAAPAAAATWTVRPGDDLWSIAEATLSRAWGLAPPQPDLAHYWWQVVQTNRPHLPNPADPNLLLPGDQVALPAPPPRPAVIHPE